MKIGQYHNKNELSIHHILVVILLLLFCFTPSFVLADSTTDDKTSATSETQSDKSNDSTSSEISSVPSTVTSETSSESKDVSTSTSISSTSTSTSATRVTITASNTVESDTAVKPTLTAVQITAVNTLNQNGNSKMPGLNSISAMPTLSSTGVPIPTVTVPSNSNNPFMSQSSLPEGTVFIAVGSILLGVALAVIGWNIAMFIIARNSKDIEYTPAGGFGSKQISETKMVYPGEKIDSSASGGVVANGHNRTVSQVGSTSGMDSSERTRSMYNSGLFFSPTAEVMNTAQHQNTLLSGPISAGGADSLTSTINSSAGVGIASGAPRASTYMPSGYYAPTTSAGVSGNTTTSVYSTAPSLHNSNSNNNNRNTMLGVTQDSVRAPSAYLDDFLGQDK